MPLDKAANADGVRRERGPIAASSAAEEVLAEAQQGESSAPSWRVAPYLHALLDEMRSTGLPTAYLPTPELDEREVDES